MSGGRPGRIGLGLAIVLAWIAACAPPTLPPTPAPVHLTLSGSTAMQPLLSELVNAFQSQHPNAIVSVQAVNSTWGVHQIRSARGEPVLGAVSTAPPADVWAAPIAQDAVALIVHPSNPLQDLTWTRLQDLFGGRLWRWSDLGVQVSEDEIVVVSREEGSGTRAVFESRVMEGRPVVPTAVVMPGSEAVVQFVATHPGAIGYVSRGQVTSQVKVLDVEGVSPSPDTVADHSYGLAQPFYLIALQEPTGVARQFVDFCLSPEGQALVARRYAPVR